MGNLRGASDPTISETDGVSEMLAYRLLDWQRAGFAETAAPTPGPAEVRVRVAAVGLCHSDVLFLDSPAGVLPYQVPFTLGHEIAGWRQDTGEPVALACVSPCGACRFCRRGADNYCVEAWQGRGFGRDGGLAPYVLARPGELVALGALDPRAVAPLTDAGATSYHAVRRVVDRLDGQSTAVVIGVGGLGSYAVQWLRRLSPARIIAVDTRPARRAAATALGADEVLDGGDGLSRRLRGVLGPDGAAAVLDFVGTDATLNAAVRNAATLGAVAVVGQGFGTAPVRWGTLAHDCDVFIPRGYTVAELREVVALAQGGGVVVEAETFAFAETADAYRRLREGSLDGRAVVLIEPS